MCVGGGGGGGGGGGVGGVGDVRIIYESPLGCLTLNVALSLVHLHCSLAQ